MTLEQLYARHEQILVKMHDPDFNKDARENSARDAVLAEYYNVCDLIAEYEQKALQGEVKNVVGTISVDTIYTIVYHKCVKNTQHLELPKPLKIKFVDDFCEPALFTDQEEVKLFSANSPLGLTVLNKLPGYFRVQTSYGYSEVEVIS